jgi:hypothetical protein
MKKIVTSNITDQARLPLLKRTLEFMRENDAETSTAPLYAMIGTNSDSVPIVLWGCEPTITTTTLTNDTLTITEGAILYDGEIYQVAAGSAVFTAGQVHTLIIVATNQTGEPTKYTDDSTHATNINYTIAPSHGVTGSGICDWDDRLFVKKDGFSYSINSDIFSAISLPAGYSLASIKVTYLKNGNHINIQGVIAISRASGTLTDFYVTLKSRAYILDGDITYPTELYAPCVVDGADGAYTGYVTNQGNISFKDRLYFYPRITLSTTGTTNVFFTLSYKTENLL